MSSRGRGYSRGSRGGGNGNSNYRGYNNQNRTSYGSRSSYNGYDRSYENRSSERNYLSSDRYSNRNDSSYKRTSDKYAGSGSSRDRSTVDRKRFRHESQGSRSHDHGAGSSTNYMSYDHREKRDENKTSRRSSSPSLSRRFRSNDSPSRRSRERMGPPKSLQPSRTYRGRGGGGSARGLRTTRMIARRNDMRTVSRQRNIPISRIQEYARKLRLLTQRRARRRRGGRDGNSSRKFAENETKERKTHENDKDDKSSNNKQKSLKKLPDGASDNIKTEKENSSEKSGSPKKLTTKGTKSEKEDLEVSSNLMDQSTKHLNENEENDNETGKDKEDVDDSNNSNSLYDPTSTKNTDDLPKSRYTGKCFIKLTCIQCNQECLTFKEYSKHLHYRAHRVAMKKLSLNQKAQLLRMRQSQRTAQRDLENKTGDSEGRPQFCPLCRLNYRQPKLKHQLSDGHRNMKKFLMPYCRVCRLAFKSPMLYEAHRCSLEHIKKKARKDNSKHSGDEEADLNLDNFMTVDSVGNSDCDENVDDIKIDYEEDKLADGVNVGGEHIKKVDAHWCDLCRVYLPHQEEFETSLKRHCGNRSHLRAYLRYRDDKSLRKTAELVHRRHQESKDSQDVDNEDIKKDDEIGRGEDEKTWEDVDKDLGELLQETTTEENGNADEEDEDSRLNAERYDRFKNSEKGSVPEEIDVKEKMHENIRKSVEASTEKDLITHETENNA